jgi:hypothetical protein
VYLEVLLKTNALPQFYACNVVLQELFSYQMYFVNLDYKGKTNCTL